MLLTISTTHRPATDLGICCTRTRPARRPSSSPSAAPRLLPGSYAPALHRKPDRRPGATRPADPVAVDGVTWIRSANSATVLRNIRLSTSRPARSLGNVHAGSTQSTARLHMEMHTAMASLHRFAQQNRALRTTSGVRTEDRGSAVRPNRRTTETIDVLALDPDSGELTPLVEARRTSTRSRTASACIAVRRAATCTFSPTIGVARWSSGAWMTTTR